MQQINKSVKEVRLFGGGSKSPIWCQIVADMLNLSVVTQQSPETALIGAAMLAKYGFDGKKPVAPKPSLIYEPNEKNVSAYKQYYEDYTILLEKMM
jgi:sugar (pentulose or hexulose) kinase